MLILAHSLFRFIWQRCVDVNTGTLSISVYLAEMCGWEYWHTLYFGLFGRDVLMVIPAHSLFRFI